MWNNISFRITCYLQTLLRITRSPAPHPAFPNRALPFPFRRLLAFAPPIQCFSCPHAPIPTLLDHVFLRCAPNREELTWICLLSVVPNSCSNASIPRAHALTMAWRIRHLPWECLSLLVCVYSGAVESGIQRILVLESVDAWRTYIDVSVPLPPFPFVDTATLSCIVRNPSQLFLTFLPLFYLHEHARPRSRLQWDR